MLRKSNQLPTPRVAPAEPPYDEETAAALAPLGPPIALFRLFARRPERAKAIYGWGSYYLSRQLALSLRHRELIINRTTALCRAEYEWGIHVALFAAKVELTGDQVRSLTAGDADDPCWTDPADRAVLRAVDALHTRSDLTDGEWLDLVSAAGEDGAIDAMLLAGWYHAISYVARATRLTAEPETPAFADYS
ncbi:carboxymuconolactone decarboxylase family protein [Streptosporangiaceae bacterium NEAU-GS5]|nr:carboxymuconolactone decarboxylase family protein [Streptosporangiaceae bacterium NEAU-GS5]